MHIGFVREVTGLIDFFFFLLFPSISVCVVRKHEHCLARSLSPCLKVNLQAWEPVAHSSPFTVGALAALCFLTWSLMER